MRKNNENEESNKAEVVKPESDHLAMEYFRYEQNKTKIWMTCAILAFILFLLVLIISCIDRWHLVETNQQNNREWRELFSEYDYISQDGEGVNNINTGSQGDVVNGPEGE